MEIKTPEALITLLEQLPLKGKERLALNKVLANHTRRFFRGQIRAQRDVHNNTYAPPSRNASTSTASILRLQKKGISKRARKRTSSKKRVEHNLTANQVYQRVTKNNNMFSGLSNDMRTDVSEEGFGVGLAGLTGHIAGIHNQGSTVSFTTRVNGWFNNKTRKWEGGKQVKNYYQMPKRTLIGWNKTLEQEIAHIILQHMQPRS